MFIPHNIIHFNCNLLVVVFMSQSCHFQRQCKACQLVFILSKESVKWTAVSCERSLSRECKNKSSLGQKLLVLYLFKIWIIISYWRILIGFTKNFLSVNIIIIFCVQTYKWSKIAKLAHFQALESSPKPECQIPTTLKPECQISTSERVCKVLCLNMWVIILRPIPYSGPTCIDKLSTCKFTLFLLSADIPITVMLFYFEVKECCLFTLD